MKKNILLLFILILNIPSHSFAQKLIFCERVDVNGNPENVSDTFNIGTKGGFLQLLLKSEKGIDSHNAVIDVYHIDENKKEIFESTIRVTVEPDFTWFKKEITFHQSGNYHVYVYDEKDKLLGVGKVTINLK